MPFIQKKSYPPTFISHTNSFLNILQLTDLHLIKKCYKNQLFNCDKGFKSVLSQALVEKDNWDLIIVTGDLIHEMNTEIYDDIFSVLTNTNIPFACISGNHDVTDEIGEWSPFSKVELIAHKVDQRLLNRHTIHSKHWQILMIDSSDPGKVSGWINKEDLLWIQKQLSTNSKPAMICLHHHPVPSGSAWMDKHILINADEFWQTILPFKHVKSVVHGHIHQEFSYQKEHVKVLGTPSTSYQFLPQSDTFAIDDKQPGYRRLRLYDDGSLKTKVKRLFKT